MTASDKKHQSEKANKRVCLGRIAAPHGVKGLVKILPYGEDPYLLEDLSPIYTDKSKDDTVRAIKLKNQMGKYILAEIEGCNTREQSDALKGIELWVDRDALPEIEDEGEFYIEDLIGLTANNENGDTIGNICAVQNFGAGDLLEIKPKSGSTFFVPFKDDFIVDINLDDGIIALKNYEIFIIS